MMWYHWFFIAIGIYAAIGALVATALMQTPYSDNGWLIIFALWPLFVLGMLGYGN